MASFNVPDYEQLVTCPYNKAHQITKARLQYHLNKCKKSNPGVKLGKCRFNNTHLVREEEVLDHEKNCPDSKYVLAEKYKEIPRSKSPDIIIKEHNLIGIDDDDNWDEQDIGESYDPKKAIKNKPIIQTVQHQTPSQRKAQRESNRRKFLELEQEKSPEKKITKQHQ